MSQISKKYFIVLGRTSETKRSDLQRELRFNVNFFYLKKFKEELFTFSYINEPFFRGTVLFGLDFKNKIRPLSFDKIDKDGVVSPINPHLFKQFLLSTNNKFIAFSNQSSKHSPAINEMLSSFQFDKNKIINLTFCTSCLDSQKFNILDGPFQIKSFKNRILCAECAYKVILSGLKSSGLFTQERINPKLKNFFIHMILKFKDVRKVLKAFNADFNPVKNREITLYDIEEKPTIGKKYLNQKIGDLKIHQSFKDILINMNIHFLLPIQAISIEKGLLNEHSNQLIMAPYFWWENTSRGISRYSKTL
ncbi:MAG: hypothetical protein ACFE8N_11650, partial [Promethearchaeota archaeon]